MYNWASVKRAMGWLDKTLNARPRLRYALREWAIPVGLPLGAITALVLPLAQGVAVKQMVSLRFLALAIAVTLAGVLATLAFSWMMVRFGLLSDEEQ